MNNNYVEDIIKNMINRYITWFVPSTSTTNSQSTYVDIPLKKRWIGIKGLDGEVQ